MPIQVSAEARDVRLCCAGCKGLQVELCYSFGVVPHYWDLCTGPPVWALGDSWKLFGFCQDHFKSEASKDMFNEDDADCKSLKKIYIYTYAAARCLVSYWFL